MVHTIWTGIKASALSVVYESIATRMALETICSRNCKLMANLVRRVRNEWTEWWADEQYQQFKQIDERDRISKKTENWKKTARSSAVTLNMHYYMWDFVWSVEVWIFFNSNKTSLKWVVIQRNREKGRAMRATLVDTARAHDTFPFAVRHEERKLLRPVRVVRARVREERVITTELFWALKVLPELWECQEEQRSLEKSW